MSASASNTFIWPGMRPATGWSFVFAGQNNCAYYSNGVQRVGQRPQGRMQQGLDPADHFKADETGEHKYVKTGEQIQLHDLFPSEPAATGAANPERQ